MTNNTIGVLAFFKKYTFKSLLISMFICMIPAIYIFLKPAEYISVAYIEVPSYFSDRVRVIISEPKHLIKEIEGFKKNDDTEKFLSVKETSLKSNVIKVVSISSSEQSSKDFIKKTVKNALASHKKIIKRYVNSLDAELSSRGEILNKYKIFLSSYNKRIESSIIKNTLDSVAVSLLSNQSKLLMDKIYAIEKRISDINSDINLMNSLNYQNDFIIGRIVTTKRLGPFKILLLGIILLILSITVFLSIFYVNELVKNEASGS